MAATRRDFIRIGAASAAALGFDLTPALAEARTLKISRTTETRSTCPYCSVSCGVIIHTEGDKSKNARPFVVHVEGDADHPINQGSLCSKGTTLRHDIMNERRLKKVLYRAPGSDQWEEKNWEFAIDRIAHLFKETRDRTFIEHDAKGNTVNALTSVGVIGGCTDTNEINYLMVKAFRAAIGVLPLEQQSRI
jgi:formate dehydrogenase major subunit